MQKFVWFNGVAVVDGQTDQIFFVRTDHIGRPVFATDINGVKVWEASYLPFGGVHVSTGAALDLRFPGQWFHATSGLHQNWMRDYDPTTGRYMQADPLGLVDGASVYGYVRQNPGRYVDPRGEETTVIISTLRGPGLGHASLLRPNLIYDPSGNCSCQYEDDGNGPYWPGSGDTYFRNGKTDSVFWRFQTSSPDGFDTSIYTFDRAAEEEAHIMRRIERLGGGAGAANQSLQDGSGQNF